MTIKTLVIDESAVCRESLKAAFDEVADIEVIGASPTGKTGVDRARQARPEIILLSAGIVDLAPEEIVRSVVEDNARVGVILLVKPNAASEEVDGAVRALGAGAFDFVSKPDRDDSNVEMGEVLRRRLLPKLRSFSAALYSRKARRRLATGEITSEVGRADGARAAALTGARASGAELVVIGVSTGGPEALNKVLPALPATLAAPVAVVIHMPPQFTSSLAQTLDKSAALEVREAVDGARLSAGQVVLAPGGRHLVMQREGAGLVTRLSDEPPENGCRPSADVLFGSAADVSRRTLALIMTGMGNDGVKGLQAVKKAGGTVLAQDEQSCVVWGMPGSAVRVGVVDEVVALDELAARVADLTGRTVR